MQLLAFSESLKSKNLKWQRKSADQKWSDLKFRLCSVTGDIL